MKKKILIIEDDVWLADSFAATLVAGGYSVVHVPSAFDSMSNIEEGGVDLIVADILLGDHTSFTLFHELQSFDDTAKIPVVICSGIPLKKLSKTDKSSYGIVAVLDKTTVTPDLLLMTVKEALWDGKRP